MSLPTWIMVLVSSFASAVAAAGEEPYTYVHHAVSTSRPAAQEAFDRGLTLVFAYQSAEAEQAFRQAARLDPGLAMAWWGIGLALGPDINTAPEPAKTRQAAEALRRASELAARRSTASEQAYIAALAQRYSTAEHPDFDALAVAYREALRRLVHDHPEDADAATLYAEAIMDLRPWHLWTAEGSPAPDTLELVQMLEDHLARAPDHIGLLHFYIHAVEASPHPERALAAARRLGRMPMEPAAAHLVHMPAHIYLRVGDWRAAIESNEHAAHHALDFQQSQKPATQHACAHCLDFLRFAESMAGDLAAAREAAEHYQQITDDPTDTLAVLLRFGQWDELLTAPAPNRAAAPKFTSAEFIEGFWHYARGMALAAEGRAERADRELAALQKVEAELPPRIAVTPGVLDVAHTLERMQRAGDRDDLAIAEHLLTARIARARHDPQAALKHLREAVVIQDHGEYSEPPNWYYPVRESLGAALLEAGDAVQAEAVFREDLRRNPNNPRSTFGLSAALRARGEGGPAVAADAEFRRTWLGPVDALRIEDL